MGTTTKRIGKDGKVTIQAKVRKNGVKQTASFDSQKKADAWITDTESKINKGESVSIHDVRKLTLASIFSDYLSSGEVISDSKRGNLNRLKVEVGAIQLLQFNTKVLGKYLKLKLGQTVPEQKNKKKDHPLFKAGLVANPDPEAKEKLIPRTYAPATIRHYYYAIRTALEWHAKENDYLFNVKPFSDNPPPGAWDHPRERRLEEGELEKLIDACDEKYKYKQDWKDLLNFQIYSCMRIGETLLMRWKDLIINENEPHGSYIHVPKEHQKTRNSKKASDRSVSMRRELYELVNTKLMPRKGKPGERVFPQWAHSGIAGHSFRTITNNAAIEDLNIHDLRHEGISWMFENTNLTDIEIAKITGHSEMDTLMRYAKLRPTKTGAKLWAGLPALV